jgi:hypothetical protein
MRAVALKIGGRAESEPPKCGSLGPAPGFTPSRRKNSGTKFTVVAGYQGGGDRPGSEWENFSAAHTIQAYHSRALPQL